MNSTDPETLERLSAIVGPQHVLTPEDRPPPGRFDAAKNTPFADGLALATVRPGDSQELSQVMQLLSEMARPVIPVGGATGLVEGCESSVGDVLLSTERFRQIESVDPLQRTMTVGAGVTLQQVQEAASEHGLYFPLDLGARGSATIGGNIATNAGGNRVIRYGMMRDLVLGLEAVTPDGKIVSSMNALMKNNTGYDLKQLFIGSEGTLGIVTRAVLRLWPAPTDRQMAFAGLPKMANVGALLGSVDRALEGRVTAFEAMWPGFYSLATGSNSGSAAPLSDEHALYVLIEVQGGEDAKVSLQQCLMEAIESELIDDVVVAQSESDCEKFWTIRDNVEPIARLGELLMYDVGLPLAAIEQYVARINDQVSQVTGVKEAVIWGHIGDGNLHIWIACTTITPETRSKVNQIVYDPLRTVGGSISAEHGIGMEKRDYLHLSRSPEEIALMRTIKAAIDPQNLLNPGKLLPDRG